MLTKAVGIVIQSNLSFKLELTDKVCKFNDLNFFFNRGDLVLTYLQLHYGNGVFGNVYLSLRGKHCRHPIAVMGVVDTIGYRPLALLIHH